jgi:membrane-associated protease RseP (regulator of RpoE activity)
MQPPQNLNNSPSQPGDSGAIGCPQCGASMPREMRFCRACGHRLGEGPAEYTETTRFPNVTAQSPRVTSAAYLPPQGGPIANQTSWNYPQKKRRKLSGMAWIFIIIAALFVVGGVMSALRKRVVRNAPHIAINMNRTYFGVDGFDEVAGGVTFDNVEPPGGPADKAGLVGGDIIQTFDGHRVTDEDEITDLLRETPIGKTVEITYLRDGELKKTQLTTISEAEFNDLQRVYRSQPKGYFGFESNRTTKIADPQTKTYGVRLDYLERNGPSELFGLQKGDIITAWDDVPIRTGDELLSRVRRAVPKSSVVITIVRDGQILKIPVTMGRA